MRPTGWALACAANRCGQELTVRLSRQADAAAFARRAGWSPCAAELSGGKSLLNWWCPSHVAVARLGRAERAARGER